jgi:hypothetical protein
MGENFIKLMIRMIAHKITKNDESIEEVYRKICISMSKECDFQVNDTPLSKSLIDLGNQIIDYYNDHFEEGFDDMGHRTWKLIESDDILLLNGKCKREYENMTFIGQGSYGSVHKAENKLDNEVYAIKKISLYSTPYELCHMNERNVKGLISS